MNGSKTHGKMEGGQFSVEPSAATGWECREGLGWQMEREGRHAAYAQRKPTRAGVRGRWISRGDTISPEGRHTRLNTEDEGDDDNVEEEADSKKN